MLLLFGFTPTNFVGGELPLPATTLRMIWQVPYALYFVLCIVFSFVKKNQSCYQTLYLFLAAFSMELLLLEFWLIISQFAFVIYALEGGNHLKIGPTFVVFSVSLFVLLGMVAIHIYVFLRVKKRVLQGHYLINGNGFWDNHTLKNKLLFLLPLLAPLCALLTALINIIAHFWGTTWDSPFAPVVTIFLALLLFLLAFPIAYGCAIFMMKIYYIKRFSENAANP